MSADLSNKKILFIINPKAGTKSIAGILTRIENFLKGKTDYEIINLNDINWNILSEIEKKVKENNIVKVIAVGGDGTVNSVAAAMINRSQILGIIPIGSGNGLARELNIPLVIPNALELIDKGVYTEIDCCYINGIPFFCTAGTGFDAHVGKIFANSPKRGFFTYVKIVTSEFLKYKIQNYVLTIDGEKIETRAYVITFANASQYGNNAVIAPLAKIDDGIIEITIVKPFGIVGAIILAIRLFTRTIHKSKLVNTYSAKKIHVLREKEDFIHFDGESKLMGRELEINIKQKILKIIPGIKNK